jgi:hypothetical protein
MSPIHTGRRRKAEALVIWPGSGSSPSKAHLGVVFGYPCMCRTELCNLHSRLTQVAIEEGL